MESSRAVIREEPWSTSGNQKWNGTSPNLIAIAIVSIRHDVGWFSCVMSHCPRTNQTRNNPNSHNHHNTITPKPILLPPTCIPLNNHTPPPTHQTT